MANLAGILSIMQTGTNITLCREFFPNPVAACGISFLVGLLTMIVICLIDEAPLPRMDKFRNCPWYCFIGGVLGGTYKTAAMVLAPCVGFTTFHIAAMAGQVCYFFLSIKLLHSICKTYILIILCCYPQLIAGIFATSLGFCTSNYLTQVHSK